MSQPVTFPGSTSVYKGPPDAGIGDLPTLVIDGVIWSCWRLSPQEQENVAKTGTIWLGCAGVQPPVCVEGNRPFAVPSEN